MNDDSNSLRLSRRRMLGGLGVVGLASAGAGLGTTAYFNDVESFVGNTLTAGSLDLFVHVDYAEDQGSYAQYEIDTVLNGNTVGEAVEGEPLRIEVNDAKPGDSGEGEICFSVVDNPAYLWVCGALTANDQNGVTEPEGDAEDMLFETAPTEGQLADAMVVTLSYCTEGEQGETVIGDEIVSGSLREVLLALRTGVALDGNGDGAATLDGRAPFEGVAGVEETAETCVCLTWEIPTSVGNEIQTDSVMFDIDFYAEQSRHNDGTHNPCVDETYAAEYVNRDGIAEPIPDGVARVDVTYGTEQVVYGIVFDEPAGSQYSLADPNYGAANFSMPFDADDDGVYDFQVAWNAEGNDEFLYSGVEAGPNWEKDTGTGWSALPAGFNAAKSGNTAVISVPRSVLDAGSDDTYLFGFNASAGGEQASVSIPNGGPYSAAQNFTASENGQETTLQ